MKVINYSSPLFNGEKDGKGDCKGRDHVNKYGNAAALFVFRFALCTVWITYKIFKGNWVVWGYCS